MHNGFTDVPTTRREFLRQSASGLGLLAFSGVAPAFLAQSAWARVPAPESGRTILVLIQLAGGNDGLNTLAPFEDDHYHRLRPKLALPARDVVRISDQLGFHPACRELAELHKSGQLAVVQNVGYPNPNRSHFRSMEIWETSSKSDEYRTSGWIGRYFDNCCGGAAKDEPLGLALGNEMPDVFLADEPHNTFNLASAAPNRRSLAEDLLDAMPPHEAASTSGNAGFLQHVHMNALVTERKVLRRLRGYQPMARYPDSQLAQSLRKIAALVAAGQETRVYFVSLGGFDTHAGQINRHQALLRELSAAMASFQADLAAHKLDDQVLTMTFSEFGRRPNENATGGTDHGTAAPLFVMGSRLTASLLGSPPDLDLQRNRDIAFTTDFRAVYSTVLERWFGADPLPVLGQRFEALPFLAKT
jgi:uncharacterized protein (DUF1501 family)